MAYGSVVTYRTLAFPWYFANQIDEGGSTIHVKTMHYPGTKGIQTLNMSQGEFRIVHTGTIRASTQDSLDAFVNKVGSVCDGAVGALTLHGNILTSIFSESVEYGSQRKMGGNGGLSATMPSHYAREFTITYVDKNTD